MSKTTRGAATMASNRPVRDWIVECLKQHLAPDALGVYACYNEEKLLVYTRMPSLEVEHCRVVTVTVGDDEKLNAIAAMREIEAERDAIGEERDRWKRQCDLWQKMAGGLADAMQIVHDQAEIIERLEARQ